MSDRKIANNIGTEEEEDNNDNSQDESDKMLGGDKERRNSFVGVQPSPMIHANIFSRYVSLW